MRTLTLSLLSVGAILSNAGVALARQAQPLAPAAPAATMRSAAPAAPADADPGDSLIGKPPPPIVVAKWAKGGPITGFEKGKVYVVDFWATWCGPCKAAIPHLTKLAQEHKGKVEVIGVSISEKQKEAGDTAYIELVEKFVAKQGDRMDYPVAIDTPEKTMHATWFKPAGTAGIPTAYIIDQNGLVAWVGIGSPKDVERIVGQVLAGTFDIKKEAERRRAAEAAARERSAADIAASKGKGEGPYAKVPGYKDAMARGDQAAALESLNTAFKNDPALEATGPYQWKIMLLLQRGKPEEVNAYGRELLQNYPDNSDVIGFLSAALGTTDTESRYDKTMILEASQRAAALAKPDTRWAQFTKWRLGWAYYHMGDRAKATESMQEALDGVRRLKDTFDFNDLETECEDALKEFATGAN